MSCVALLLDRNILSKFIGYGSKNIDHSGNLLPLCQRFLTYSTINKPFVKSSSASKTWGVVSPISTIDMLMYSILGL